MASVNARTLAFVATKNWLNIVSFDVERPLSVPYEDNAAGGPMKRTVGIVLVTWWWGATAVAQEETTTNAANGWPVIRVSSNPTGAQIIIDGYPCGDTPAVIAVPPGRHEVVVAKHGRRSRVVVFADHSVITEVALELGLSDQQVRELIDVSPPWHGASQPSGAIPGDGEAPPHFGEETSGGRGREAEPPPERRWSQRIPVHSWLELRALVGAMNRTFTAALVDQALGSPLTVGMASGGVGLLGVETSVYPLARSRRRLLRGLGLYGRGIFALGMYVENTDTTGPVDSMYYEIDVGAQWRLLLGRPNVGATIVLGLGWHRTAFYLGRHGNQYVPPIVADAARLGVTVQVPLGIPYVLADLRGSYLPIGTVGDQAVWALGQFEGAHGGEVQLGALARIGYLEFGLYWVGRFLAITFDDQGGGGWGDTLGSVRATDTVTDTYHQFRFAAGLRL
jgi:hypothetical protein